MSNFPHDSNNDFKQQGPMTLWVCSLPSNVIRVSGRSHKVTSGLEHIRLLIPLLGSDILTIRAMNCPRLSSRRLLLVKLTSHKHRLILFARSNHYAHGERSSSNKTGHQSKPSYGPIGVAAALHRTTNGTFVFYSRMAWLTDHN